ncbi:MAG: FAD-dependent oxidoreductase [Burkholderiales bacterium]|nr:FAD-dependent oxidoreductase [Burkholderiales bacterium]
MTSSDQNLVSSQSDSQSPRRLAVIGAGMAGVSCARQLAQAGWSVTLLDKSRGWGGRMATRKTEFGSFDHGAQYFTVRDARFEQLVGELGELVQPWAPETMRVLDQEGLALAASPAAAETHWVASPGMSALARALGAPLADGSLGASVSFGTRVKRIERDAIHPDQWQLRCEGAEGAQQVLGGFDQVVLALPQPQALELLQESQLAPELQQAIAGVEVAPCWTLMLAFPQATSSDTAPFGPTWNAARSQQHRVRWLARENSKPGRGSIERWTVQASPEWSTEHVNDDAERVSAKLLKGFAEITGIHAEPSHAVAHRWLYAQTRRPLGQPYLADDKSGIALCGDWCLGHRVEDAFVSGLELGLHLAA